MAADYYQTLGVARDATPEEIKRAYRRLARELHPDVNPDPSTHEKFKDVTAAYEVLSDPRKRQMYDLGHDPRAGAGGGSGAAGFGAENLFEDLMNSFFGGGGGGASRGPKPRTRRGQDALLRVEVDLSEAVFGTEKEITVDTAVGCPTCHGGGTADGASLVPCPMCRGRGEVQNVQRTFLGQVMTARACPQCQGYGTLNPSPCPECAGDGRVRTRQTIKVEVPPGVETGTRLLLSGQGEVGPGSGPAGDVYVEIIQKPHPIFERQGNDLHVQLSIPMTAAALGTVIPLQTLDGEQKIDVRAGTQSGSVQTLRGLGAAKLQRSGRGDLHVHIDVVTPTKLDTAQRELIEQLAVLRDEEHVEPSVAEHPTGLFSRIKEAFSGK
ncbi:MAG: molecular chaperone DnaJ [Actinobacteria bacterium]|nr:molecular chaperone DnaJ [Actinomycetota bacterium]MCB9413772.1 molecular chaperone DnaJ [Actinomycetota bacterium]MCB9424744.1 molecular chaperone DnaJ [Actinomycetota bacterium]HRY11720.1 molecular chaperone DnaJ [Candidatus Nanopelagicales bacterium]